MTAKTTTPGRRSARMLSLLALSTALVAGTATAQEVTVIREIDTPNYDLHKQTSQAAAELIFLMGDTLVYLDYDMQTLHPGLAESWSVSDDGLTYTFKLRDDVTFCSGKKLTAQDAAFSLNRLISPDTKSPVAWRAGSVDSITALDDTTLEYKLKVPFSELLYQLTQSFTSIINEDNVKELGENFGVAGFDGTGPYCWESWTPRDKMVVTRHDAYKWGPSFYENTGPAKIARMTWQVVPEANTRAVALMTGQADLTYYTPYFAISQLRAAPGFRVEKSEIAAWTQYFGFKTDKPAVSDPAMRKAMTLALDTTAMVEDLYFGELIPARTYVHSSAKDFVEGLEGKIPAYNVEEANKILDEAGWVAGSDGIRSKDGVRAAPVLYVFAGSSWAMASEYLQGEMRKIGVDVQIQPYDATVGWAKLATQEFDMYGMGYPYLSAGDALNLNFPSTNIPAPNRMNWKDAETDAWLTAGKVALDDAGRADAYGSALTKVHENYVWLPFYHLPSILSSTEKLKPIKPHTIYGAVLYKGLDVERAD